MFLDLLKTMPFTEQFDDKTRDELIKTSNLFLPNVDASPDVCLDFIVALIKSKFDKKEVERKLIFFILSFFIYFICFRFIIISNFLCYCFLLLIITYYFGFIFIFTYNY